MHFTQNRLIYIVSFFFVLLYNFSFFSNVIKVYPINLQNILFLISIVLVFWAFLVLFLQLLSYKYTIKPLLILLFILSSFAAYFMDTYGVMIDDGMLINALQTDTSETMGLVSIKMAVYFVFLGILPSILIYKIRLRYKDVKKELLSKLTVIGVSLLLIISTLVLFGGNYASFFREHKHIRQYTNPTFWIYSVSKVTKAMVKNRKRPLVQVGTDAKISEHARKKILIMVVGEAARWDHFSLNGYARETNPLLKQKDIVNLSNVYSCGTSTAHSVPCMFSI